MRRWGRRNKYGAKKTFYNGILFDSINEKIRYQQLELLAKSGQIRDLKHHPKFDLVINDIYIGYYTGDSSYFEQGNDCRIVEDVKGYIDTAQAFRLKVVKACLAPLGIEVRVWPDPKLKLKGRKRK